MENNNQNQNSNWLTKEQLAEEINSLKRQYKSREPYNSAVNDRFDRIIKLINEIG